MLISMTGYGQGEVVNQSARVSVEIRTVNHRFLDFSVKMPREFAQREQEVKETIREKFSRGRITVAVAAETEVPEYDVIINAPLMEQYLALLQGFAQEHGLSPSVDINTLAALPDAFVKKESVNTTQALWPMVQQGLGQAIDACMRMRLEEGKVLEEDIRARISEIQKAVRKIKKLAPGVIKRHTEAFRKRLGKILEGAKVDNDRWMTEIAILADKLDFTEELIRLESHLAQFRTCLDEGGVVSKKLTYLLQEIHRETTTIGSKASDADIVSCVVSLKEESEKLREQVQNIE